MFDSETRTLIHHFNQYNKIPNAIPSHYVESCLNQTRRRQSHPPVPKVLHINSLGVVSKTSKHWDIGGLTTTYTNI